MYSRVSSFMVKPTGEAGSFRACADFGWEPLHAAAAGSPSNDLSINLPMSSHINET